MKPFDNNHPARILIAEPNLAHREELQQILCSAGYDLIAETETSDNVVRLTRLLRPDILIISNALQPQGGTTVAKEVLEKRLAPVILTLEDVTPEIVRVACAVGVTSLLSKPLRVANLIPAIELAQSRWAEALKAQEYLHCLQEKESTRDAVDNAKRALMESCNMSEKRAYRFIQRHSIDTRSSMRQVAEAILNDCERVARPRITSSVPVLEGSAR